MKERELEEIFGRSTTVKPIDLSAFDNMTIDALEAKRNKKIRDSETDPLIESLQDATHINEATKEKLIKLAHIYLEDMRDNILKNQFDLAEKYPDTTADDWTTFLVDRVVSTYINKHKTALLKSTAERNLADPYAKNKRDNIKMLDMLNEKSNENKQQVVIIRIPNKYEEDTNE